MIILSAPWSNDQARERYVRFLELEFRLMRNASEGKVDTDLLEQMTSLLRSFFPRTLSYLERRSEGDIAAIVSGELRTVAWAEARAVPGEGGIARVPGAWTEQEIATDINECFAEARKRLDI